MDITLELNGISFVWNQSKANINIKNHKVTFEQAAEVLFDPFVRIIDASPKEEVRDAAIGMDKNWNLLFVVHVFIENDFIRIVSARKATSHEKVNYEN